MLKDLFCILGFGLLVTSCNQKSAVNLVSNLEEFNQAAKSAQPGSTITMANGDWVNVELRLKGKGEKDNPIKLVAETPGQVVIRSEEHTSELQSHSDLVCRLLLEKKKKYNRQ